MLCYVELIFQVEIKNISNLQVLLTILLSWALCVLLTSIDVFERGNPARTDIRISVLIDSPWFRFPYPGM